MDHNELQNLKAAKSTGPNSLQRKLLKQTKEIISLPLSKLINNSFNQGVFSTAFKTAKVVTTIDQFCSSQILAIFKK